MKITAIFLVIFNSISQPVWGRLGEWSDERAERFLGSLNENDDGSVDVIIGLKPQHKKGALDELQRSILSDSNKRGKKSGLKKVNAASARLTKQEIKKLLKRGDIEYIEEDYPVYMDNINEVIPYGLLLTQGMIDTEEVTAYSAATNTTTGACNDPNSFKVAIIDSGATVNHPDLPCRDINAEDTNCVGIEFGVENELWYDPKNPHGTHVFGIIGARRNNELGIMGQVADSNVCYLIAQIFGEDGTSRNSAVIDAVDWAIDLGARVINMSLGSSTFSISARAFFDQVRAQGVIVVSASGNDGSTNFHYPASYASVMSVASVDANLQRSSFSQENSHVNIAAPGSNILSTFPSDVSNAATIQGVAGVYLASYMLGSAYPEASGVKGTLIFCQNLGRQTCDGPGGHICLIPRGGTSFEAKAANCQAGGGIAAIIYNSDSNVTLFGSFNDEVQVSIPVFGMSAVDATDLYTTSFGKDISIQAMVGYAFMDGTSMSTPQVAGAMTEIWRHCPLCSADEVEHCLFSTVLPLDNAYGYGLLQTQSAYSCLLNQTACCLDTF